MCMIFVTFLTTQSDKSSYDQPVAYPEILFGGGGGQQIHLRTEDRDLGGSSPLLRGSGGSCNFVQEISFHIVKSSNCWYFKTIYDDNQFICHC